VTGVFLQRKPLPRPNENTAATIYNPFTFRRVYEHNSEHSSGRSFKFGPGVQESLIELNTRHFVLVLVFLLSSKIGRLYFLAPLRIKIGSF
jgi:hypothetical protein